MALSFRQKEVRLTLVFNTVLFPFDPSQFLTLLSRREYVLSEELPPVPMGAGLQISGPVGTKGLISAGMDTGRKFVSVQGPDERDLIEELDTIESILQNELEFEYMDATYYYQFVAGAVARISGKSPLDTLATTPSIFPALDKVTEALGRSASVFGIRLSPEGVFPNSPSWFDITINPYIFAPDRYYYTRVLYREPARKPVVQFARHFEDFLSETLAAMEG